MIPPVIDSDCRSRGEHEIFHRLKNDVDTTGWIALHSLDIANHRRQISGEIDFVIIIPFKGVICLEVKACNKLSRKKGMWFYGTDPNPDPRGPFKQASMAMHSMRTAIVKQNPSLAAVPFWSAVAFPYVEFLTASDEWHSWQVIDSKKFRSQGLGQLLNDVIDQARIFLHSCSTAAWFNPLSNDPTPQQCETILNLLRPSFEFFESPKSRMQRVEEELKYYTEEQFAVLDVMERNQQITFNGPAGTGKTLLAVEAARRSALKGGRTLFLCFNRNLGKWLEEQTVELKSTLFVGTLHKYMLNIAQIRPKNHPSFWQQELPTIAIDSLIEDGNNWFFDELIIDEAQDILPGNLYLDVLDLSLKGGLTSGRWRFFGDFYNQAIYNNEDTPDNFFNIRGLNIPNAFLTANCRNTPRTVGIIELLGGLEPGYSKVLRPDDGFEPILLYYDDLEHQKRLLQKVLQDLYEKGFSGKDIVILSTEAEGACASKLEEQPWKSRIRPFGNTGKGYIGYCTVHSFKGMEAPVIILTDFSRFSGRLDKDLFYIAATRSKLRLIVLASIRVKENIVHALLDGGNVLQRRG